MEVDQEGSSTASAQTPLPSSDVFRADSSDPVLELAYVAAVRALEQQDQTLSNLRDRAAGLISAVTIATTFAAALGLFGAEPGEGPPLPAVTKWLLLSLLITVGGLSIAVTWPVRIGFGVDPRKVLAAQPDHPTIDMMRRYLVDKMIEAHGLNQNKVRRKFRYFQGAVVTLMVETAVLVLALV